MYRSEQAARISHEIGRPELASWPIAYRGMARALAGDVGAAESDFETAIVSQDSEDPHLRSDGGILEARYRLLRGEYSVAREVAEYCRELARRRSPDHYIVPEADIVLAEIAVAEGDAELASRALADLEGWTDKRGVEELKCRAYLARSRCEVVPSPDGFPPRERLRRSLEHVGEGLRIAGSCGFRLHYLDLVLQRAYLELLSGSPRLAAASVRLALEHGVDPPAGSGLARILPAEDEKAPYAWGRARGRRLYGQSILLEAAQRRAAGTDERPDVEALIEQGLQELTEACRLAESLGGPLHESLRRELSAVQEGTLTPFDVDPGRVPDSDPVRRRGIFVSYSHEDADWLARFSARFSAEVGGQLIRVWDDRRIEPGDRWLREITRAIEEARVAVLLVTPRFLESRFIREVELPALLEAARAGRLRILWIPVERTSHSGTELRSIQALIDPARPIAEASPEQRGEFWSDACRRVRRAFVLSASVGT